MVGVWLRASAPRLQPGQRLLLAGPGLCRPTDGTPGRVPPPGGRAATGRVSPGGAAAGQGEPPGLCLSPSRAESRRASAGESSRRASPGAGQSQLGYLQSDPAGATGSGSGAGRWTGFPGPQRERRAWTQGLASSTRAFFSDPPVPLLRPVGAAAGTAARSSPGRWARAHGAGAAESRTFHPKLRSRAAPEPLQPFCRWRWELQSLFCGGVQEEMGEGGVEKGLRGWKDSGRHPDKQGP